MTLGHAEASIALKQDDGQGYKRDHKSIPYRGSEWVLVIHSAAFSSPLLLAEYTHTLPQDVCGEGPPASVGLAASRVSP